jgi:hypothetical protein
MSLKFLKPALIEKLARILDLPLIISFFTHLAWRGSWGAVSREDSGI